MPAKNSGDITASPPDPMGGWSEDIATLTDALIVPPTVSGFVQECGVYSEQGQFCQQAVTWRGARATFRPTDNPPVAEATLKGRYLFAGQMWQHFGHFIVESLSRLWALDHIKGKIDGIVFIAKRPGLTAVPTDWRRKIFDYLGIEVPIFVIGEPTNVTELMVPGQGFGLGAIAEGTPAFRAYFARNFAPGIKPDGPEKIYISRTNLGPNKGSIFQERILEHNLAKDGYVAITPEKMGLEEQIATYRAAKHVIGADGSAFHMLGLASIEKKKIAVIRRRSSKVYHSLIWQLRGSTGQAPAVIDALERDWYAIDARRAVGRNSWGQLDFRAVADQLCAAGMISSSEGWRIPNNAGKQRFANRLADEWGKELDSKPARRDATFDQPANMAGNVK